MAGGFISEDTGDMTDKEKITYLIKEIRDLKMRVTSNELMIRGLIDLIKLKKC